MKIYLVVFVLIMGFFIYAAYKELSYASKGLSPGRMRYESIVERVNLLEEQRMKLFRGLPRRGAPAVARVASRASAASRGAGSYGRGYAMGFYQGYETGEYLSRSRKPNPAFFQVPSPY